MTTAPPQRPMIPRSGPPNRPVAGVPRFAANIDPIRVLRRHMGWIMLSAVVGIMLGAVAFVLLQRYYPLYSSEAIFEIQPGVSDSLDVGAREIGSDQLAARLANTETVLLLNPEILRTAVRHPDMRQTRWYQQFVNASSDGNESFDVNAAVDELLDTLSPSVIRGTNFFMVRWRWHHAPDVSVVLNNVATAYLERRKEINESEWVSNLQTFVARRDNTARELDDLDQEIRAFIRAQGITSLTDPRYSQASIAAEQLTEQIGSTTASLNMAEVMLMQTAAKLVGTIQPTPEDIHEADLDPQMSSVQQMVTSLRTQLRTSRERLNPQHPSVVQLESQLRAAELELEQLREQIVKRNLEGRHKQLMNSIESMRDNLEKLYEEADAKDAALRDLAADQAKYQALESRRARLESQLEVDVNLIREIEVIRARVDANRVRLAQQAELPRELSFPRLELMLPLGMLLMMALTTGLIFLRELTDQRIKGASDLSVVPNANVVGVIPELDEDPTNSTAAELVVRTHPQSVLAESYRQATTSVLRAAERSAHQTILFLGGLPGSGTTTAVTNIAASLAASGKRVLVVDANFRRSRLAAAMKVAGDHVGLGDLLVGNASIDEAVQQSDYGVEVISAGTPSNRVFERLNNGLFENIIADLRSRYDIILFDSPPAIVAGDAMVLANRVDAALLVARANQDQRGMVARLINQLVDARCESIGILLNRPRRTAGGYFKKNFEAMASYSKDGK